MTPTPEQKRLDEIALKYTKQQSVEIWVCGHTKKCGWSGLQSELVYVADNPGRFKLPSSTGTCPKCGQHKKGFYVRKQK